MNFEYLDDESEKVLEELISEVSKMNHGNILFKKGAVIENLLNNGYLRGIEYTSLSSVEPQFKISGLTQKGKTYFEMKQKYEKEQKRLSTREWRIAIISALIGAAIGLIPSLLTIFQ